jgi:hypothetical protein
VEGEHWKEPKVDTALIEKMSDEQLGQVRGEIHLLISDVRIDESGQRRVRRG